MPQVFVDFFSEGRNPIEVLLLLFQNGGLVIFFPLLLWMCWSGWHIWIQEKYIHKKKRVLLAIDVPKLTEQNMKAIEQIVIAMHGVHFSPNQKEKHWIGVSQDNFSLEIVSIDGYIQYFVRCDDYNADLVKGAIFAQYPDAEIVEVEDYVTNAPRHFPNSVFDMWGCEFVLAKNSAYPIKTYEHFEHGLSGAFADPLSDVLESLSRIRPGEQIWLQIVITPEGHEWREHAQHEVDTLIGKPEHHSTGIIGAFLDFVLDTPVKALGAVHEAVFNTEAEYVPPARAQEEEKTNFMALTTGEKIVVEEVQKKLARLVFETKFRFIYIAPKSIMNVYRVAGPIFGAVKQFNALDLNSFTAGGHSITSGPTYYMVKRRLLKLKNHLMEAYRHRSTEEGEAPYVMSATEIATIFHFPGETVRAPLVSKTDSKKAEPPTRLPWESSPFVSLRPGQRLNTPLNVPAPQIETVVQEPPLHAAGGPLHSMPGLPPGVRPVAHPVSEMKPPPPASHQPAIEVPVPPNTHTQTVTTHAGPPANLPFG